MVKHHDEHHDDYDEKYTDPELRRRLKDEIMASDKGGKPGQWSARKSQLLVREYEQQGGGYKGEKDEAARSLEEWSEQDWQTEDGDDRAREGKVTKRYLPREVWEKLTEEEKAEAELTKEEASKHGEQHVGYTDAIKRALHEVGAEHHPDADSKEAKQKDAPKKSAKKQAEKQASKKQPEAKQSEQSDQEKPEKSDKKQPEKQPEKRSNKKQSETRQSEKSDKKKSQQKGKSDDSDHSLSQKDLYEQARELQIAGRSKMSRQELEAAISQSKR